MTLLGGLKKYLIEKKYKPGEKIATEMELAAHFQISRNKIREATTTLCQLGILEKKARRGTILKAIDPESIGNDLGFRFSLADFNPADFQEARQIIEKAILPLSARRMTPVIIAELETAAWDMKINIGNPELADAADHRFHMLLLQACGNQTLQAFGQIINALFRQELREQYWNETNLTAASQDHLKLVEALKNNDIEQAISIMNKHFR